ncbi:MAG TPA: hypothetical protein DEA50_13780 [Parvularcula sp.]|nr:hypothetical protein [Parvularcula sp.]
MGGYLVFSSIGFLQRKNSVRMIGALRETTWVAHTLGAIAFFAGGFVFWVCSRPWSGVPEAILSLVGAWWMLEGAILLAFPQIGAALPANADRHLQRMNAPSLLIGAYLLGVGIFG